MVTKKMSVTPAEPQSVHNATMYLKPEDESFLTFIWNSKKKEFLGRTGKSWAKITGFYIVYYACLAAFFAAMLAVFYQTLDTKPINSKPSYVYPDSILFNPALGYRPRNKEVISTLIHFQPKPTSEEGKMQKQHFIKELDDFIEGEYINKTSVANGANNGQTCLFNENEPEEVVYENLKGCKFNHTWVENFNGIASQCTSANKWGYDDGSPCVLIKMNRIIDFNPDYYTSEDNIDEIEYMPDDLKAKLKQYQQNQEEIPKVVWLSCQGEHTSDRELLYGGIEYFPIQGFPDAFFPYENDGTYKSPLVSVQFKNPTKNVLINIQCYIFAKNIQIVKAEGLGMVEFELLIDEKREMPVNVKANKESMVSTA